MITNFEVTTTTTIPAFQALTSVAVTAIYVCNVSMADSTINVYVVPSADSVGDKHIIYKNLIIRAGDTYIMDTEKLILSTGDKIFIVAPDSTGDFKATISTIEI